MKKCFYVFMYLHIYVFMSFGACLLSCKRDKDILCTYAIETEYRWPSRFINPTYNSDFPSSQIMSPDPLKIKDLGFH